MCMSLTHRLQLLLDEAQFERLAHRSSVEGRSIGALVREAIDASWVEVDVRRRRAGDSILNAEPMPVPDPEDLRCELDEVRAGRFA